MQPLSWRLRALYLVLFMLLFVALLPIVILYADGWRFSRSLGVYKTGGVYVSVPYGDVVLTLNGEFVGKTGLLQRSFYIDDLAPSTYVLRAGVDGYYPWERMVVVEPQLVTDARVLLLPVSFETERLVVSGNATGTQAISEALLAEYRTLFAATTPASSTVPVDTEENIGLFVRDGNLIARWLRADSPVPSMFCSRPSYCVPEIVLEGSGETALSGQFFEGGVLFRTKEGGLYFTEADVRPAPRSMLLYQKPNIDFRVVNGRLIVKDGASFYEISGL